MGFRLAEHKAHSPGDLAKYASQRARMLEQRGPTSISAIAMKNLALETNYLTV
jgi:hypothetical protein